MMLKIFLYQFFSYISCTPDSISYCPEVSAPNTSFAIPDIPSVPFSMFYLLLVSQNHLHSLMVYILLSICTWSLLTAPLSILTSSLSLTCLIKLPTSLIGHLQSIFYNDILLPILYGLSIWILYVHYVYIHCSSCKITNIV